MTENRTDSSSADYWRPTLELMLDEARRSVDRQGEILHRCRERAGSLVGFGSVVAAGLGLAPAKPVGWFGAVGLIAFVVAVAAAIFVMFPRRFLHDLSATKIDSWLDEKDNLGNDHVLWSTALAHQSHYDSNYAVLARMQTAIAAIVVALGVETLALAMRLVM